MLNINYDAPPFRISYTELLEIILALYKRMYILAHVSITQNEGMLKVAFPTELYRQWIKRNNLSDSLAQQFYLIAMIERVTTNNLVYDYRGRFSIPQLWTEESFNPKETAFNVRGLNLKYIMKQIREVSNELNQLRDKVSEESSRTATALD